MEIWVFFKENVTVCHKHLSKLTNSVTHKIGRIKSTSKHLNNSFNDFTFYNHHHVVHKNVGILVNSLFTDGQKWLFLSNYHDNFTICYYIIILIKWLSKELPIGYKIDEASILVIHKSWLKYPFI